MISKEEYKKTLIRMWDSVREECKGANCCDGVNCNVCPATSMCGDYMENVNNAYDLIELVEKWANEHPIETNGSRFLKNYPKAEVFSYDDRFIFIRLDNSIKLYETDENNIKIPRTWWESEVEDANCN